LADPLGKAPGYLQHAVKLFLVSRDETLWGTCAREFHFINNKQHTEENKTHGK